MDNVLGSNPAPPSSIPGICEIFSDKKLLMLPRLSNSAAAQSSGQQRLNYVDRTHLALASGKLVLQKVEITFSDSNRKRGSAAILQNPLICDPANLLSQLFLKLDPISFEIFFSPSFRPFISDRACFGATEKCRRKKSRGDKITRKLECNTSIKKISEHICSGTSLN